MPAAPPVALRAAEADAVRLLRILGLILFGISFGYVEASVVVYLRTLGTPVRAAAGLPVRDLFPLLRLDQLPPTMLQLLRVEIGREAATLLMIAGVACTAMANRGRLRSEWLGAFLLAFGVWDLTFYGWLRVFIGWPPSLLTWDILFLLPVPWVAPVLAPAIVAATMSVFGALLLLRDRLARGGWLATLLLIGGSLVILGSFTFDWRTWMNGVAPASFPWAIFGLGEAVVLAGVARCLIPASE